MNERPPIDKFEPLTDDEIAAIPATEATEPDKGECVMPVPADAPPMPDMHPKLGKPSAQWPYRDGSGALLFEVWRFDPAGERKQFLPLSLWRESTGALRWRWKGVPEPRPLYGLDKLAANLGASAVICEGEKATDAAVRIFPKSVCMTSPGGSQAASKADWTPLAGRNILIWPDADDPGGKYADKVAAILCGLGCSVSVVDALALASLAPDGGQRGPEKGWDAADAIGEWTDLAALRKAAVALAKPFIADQASGRPAIVNLQRASDLKAMPISWVWPGWLARGKAHIIGGQPGAGKTTLAMKIAAAVTTGGRWPDGTTATKGNVAIWSGEDDPADTLVPRLAASGADLNRVFFVQDVIEGNERRHFDPAKDIGPLKKAIESAGGAVLLIVDPIVSAVAGDSHKNGETRRALQPLVDLASDVKAAFLGVTHFSKGTSGREPIERITGSIAFGALARIVMVAAKEPEAEDGIAGRRILARAKSNIGPDEGGFAYSLELVPMPGNATIEASVAVWGERIDGTARDMLAVAETSDDDGEVSAFNEAKDFLLDFLMDGPKPARECKAAISEAGLSLVTVKRAKSKLRIASIKDGMTGSWRWSLPEGDHQNPKGLTPESMSLFEKHDPLRGVSETIRDSASEAISDGWEGEI